MASNLLTTARLRLEPYTDAHVEGLHRLNSDPEVMRFLTGQPDTLEQTRHIVERVQARWREQGTSWWSFIERASGEIIGAGCIQPLRREPAPEPDPACPLEIRWRLRHDRWHQGFASEAARAMADFAFGTLHARELYAVCNPDNTASSTVMKRLGMDHLGLETWYGKPLTTYRISAEQWEARATAGGQAPT